MSTNEPVVFGRYLLLERIAAGGMAEVYRAKSYGVAGFEKLLVIKKILPHLSKNEHFISMFIKEAKIAVSLNHKSVIQVFDLGKVGEDYYIAMEFVHGRDLRQITRACARRRVPLPLPLAVYALGEVIAGLDYAHRRKDAQDRPLNIIHMDVSPQNVLVSFEGDVKIGDFGIAHAVGGEGKLRGGMLRGKYAYMSPEMASGKPVDQRTDLFSAGVILHELITGKRLFWEPDEFKVIENVRNCNVTPPSDINPSVPPRLNQIAMKALAKDPGKRYQSAQEMRADLTEVLFGFARVVDSADLAELMRTLFDSTARQAPGSTDLSNLISDVDRLRTGPRERPDALAGPREDASLSESGGTGSTDGPEQPLPSAEEALSAEWTLGIPAAHPEVTVSGERKRILVMGVRIDTESEEARQQLSTAIKDRVRALEASFSVADDGNVLAYFGIPKIHEDEVARTLSCAREVLSMARKAAKKKVPVAVAIVVHNGTVAVTIDESSVANLAKNVDGVSGAPVLVVRQLLRRAEVAKVTVSRALVKASPAHTFVKIEPDTDLENGLVLERFVLAEKGASASPAEAPLVGRDRELALIRDLLTKVGEGKGQILSLVGEAGIGKSRLVRELRSLVQDRDIAFYNVSAGALGHSGAASALFSRLVEQICGITPEDDESVALQKTTRLAELGLDPNEVRYIQVVLGIARPEVTHSGELESGQEAVAGGVRKMIEALASDRPLILAFEDFQQIDALDRELLGQILDATESKRVFALLTYRPDFKHNWWNRLNYNQIAVRSLADDDAKLLLQTALEAKRVPRKVTDVVIETAAGNPLFIEQLAEALLHSGKVERRGGMLRVIGTLGRVEVPATLQATVTARLDRLSHDCKRVLQIGSVVGQRFSYPMLLEMAGASASVDGALVDLQREGLLLEAPEESELYYEFRHPAVWQVAYHSLPADARRRFHKLAAEGLLRAKGGRIGEPVEALAHHFERAEENELAVDYLERSGDLQATAHRTALALGSYRRAREIAANIPGRPARRQLMNLALKIGRMAMREELYEEAEEAFRVAAETARVLKDGLSRGWALKELGDLYRIAAEFETAREVLTEALEASETIGDKELLFEVLEAQGHLYMFSGESKDAMRDMERGLTVAREIGKPEAIARALNALAMLHDREERHEIAEQQLSEAVKEVRRGRDKFLAARVMNNAAAVFAVRKALARARELFEESLEINREIGYKRGVVVNLHNLGELCWREGDVPKAQYYFAESEALADEIGWRPGVVINSLFLNYFRVRDGHEEDGVAELRSALAEAEQLEHREGMAVGRFLLGSVLLERGDEEQGDDLIAQAKQIADEIGMRDLLEDIASRAAGTASGTPAQKALPDA